MSNDIGDQFNRDVLGAVTASNAQMDVPEEFKHETLGVVHPGHEAVALLDPEYFAH